MQPIPFEVKPGLQVVHLPTIAGSATAQLGSFWFKAALLVEDPEGVLVF